MKIIKKLICCSLVLLVIGNLILPNLSFAVRSYFTLTKEELVGVIHSEAEDKIREKIQIDQANDDENYTLTKSLLKEMDEYIQELSQKATILATNMRDNNTTEGLEEFRICVQSGLNNYFSDSYAKFLLEQINQIEIAAKNEENLSMKLDYINNAAGATKMVVADFLGHDEEIDEKDIEILVSTLGNKYQQENEDKQVEAIVEDIKQKVYSAIEGYTEGQEEELINTIKQQVESVQNENVSDSVKAKVKAQLEELFYKNGEVDIETTQNNLHNSLKKPAGSDIVQEEYNPDPLKGRFLSGVLDGALGIILYPVKIVLVIPGVIINMILGSIVSIGGNSNGYNVTLENILFNKFDITKINVFEVPDGTASAIRNFRGAIAGFYIAFRNLAIVLSLAMLIYIGIRMAISSIAEEKAKYKQMLINWVVGFGLIFVLHYIIIITINANELLVGALEYEEIALTDHMNSLVGQIWKIPFTTSFAAIVMYAALLIMTFSFLIVYIKRMIIISFLIVISPLISVTYAADKVGNNKSEILNTWIREFLFNVLIQPFHCLIYSVFTGIAMKLMQESGALDFGAMVFAIIMTLSIYFGEKIVKEIFGFSKSQSLAKKIAVIALAKKAVNNVTNVVALKGAANEIRAQHSMRKLPKQLPSGKAANLDNMVAERVMAEQNRMNENTSSAGTPKPVPSPTKTTTSSGTKTSVKKRRRLKNLPKPIKKATRFYGSVLATASGYNLMRNIIAKRKESRNYKMNARDYFIAASEDYRNTQKKPMNNEELALKTEELFNKDWNDIDNVADLNYKLWIESMKKQFGSKGADALNEMKDSIINGSRQNRRWAR